jgi:hypothetical protein
MEEEMLLSLFKTGAKTIADAQFLSPAGIHSIFWGNVRDV